MGFRVYRNQGEIAVDQFDRGIGEDRDEIPGPRRNPHGVWNLPYGTAGTQTKKGKDVQVLYSIAVILLLLWLLGIVSSYTMGGLIHMVLVIALIIFVVGLIQKRKV